MDKPVWKRKETKRESSKELPTTKVFLKMGECGCVWFARGSSIKKEELATFKNIIFYLIYLKIKGKLKWNTQFYLCLFGWYDGQELFVSRGSASALCSTMGTSLSYCLCLKTHARSLQFLSSCAEPFCLAVSVKALGKHCLLRLILFQPYPILLSFVWLSHTV